MGHLTYFDLYFCIGLDKCDKISYLKVLNRQFIKDM